MRDLDTIGAESGLRDQYVVVRVRAVDEAKLRRAVGAEGGWKGPVAAAALSLVDSIPKAALDVALPAAAGVLRTKYGIDADVKVAAAASATRGRSEFWPGLGVGIVAGGVAVGASRLIWLLLRRIF